MDLSEVAGMSQEIRELYHGLEKKYHGSKWSTEEDALAFLTDAGLVGRMVMDHEGRWPEGNKEELAAKIGECVWWLAVLAARTGCDFSACTEQFLRERLKDLR